MSGLRERMSRLRGLSGGAAGPEAGGGQGREEAAERDAGSGRKGPVGAVTAGGAVPAADEDGREAAAAVSPAQPDVNGGERSAAELFAIGDGCSENALHDDSNLSPEWDRLGVRMVCNEYGGFLLRETVYPLDYRHGHHLLSEWKEAALNLAAFHSKPGGGDDAGEAGLPAEQVLFLDLETTGLGVGAGNVPFMVGVAYAEGGEFVVEQYLIRHPAEERAMLEYLTAKLKRFLYLVTYNGKTFDWPLMENRFIMNGMGRRIWEPAHLDLLHPSRSIWRNTLASCRLSHVEEERLGIVRTEDVPGSLAPAIYFQFLADGNPGPLEGVFRHNELDMLSLAALAIRFGRLLGGDIGRGLAVPEDPEELLRTGLWLEKMGRGEDAERLYARLTAAASVPPSTLLPLAARDKKAGNWQRAVLLWQKAAAAMEESIVPSWTAHVELAMYYEHKCKDYGKALSFADDALSLAVRNSALTRKGSGKAGRTGGAGRRDELEQLRKRKERLLRKTGGLMH